MLLSWQLFFARTMLTNMPKGQRAHRVCACAAKPQQTGLQGLLLTRWAAAAATTIQEQQQQQQKQQQLERELRQQQQRQQSRQAFYRAVLYQVLIRHPLSPSSSPFPFLLCTLVQWRLLQFLVQLILSEVSHCCRAKPQFCVACGECGECVQWRPLLSPAVQLKHSTAAAFSLSLCSCVCACRRKSKVSRQLKHRTGPATQTAFLPPRLLLGQAQRSLFPS